jgi:iron complex transport system ATP-binding protein
VSNIQINSLRVGYGTQTVLNDISLTIRAGERWAIIGKNGSGKSTLIKTLAALLPPASGTVSIDGGAVASLRARSRARMIAYVPQKLESTIHYSVHDFVMLGRYATMGLFGVAQPQDEAAVALALELCDVAQLKNRLMHSLSGGEVQRVLLAGALAQDCPILLLDEPTTYLDPAHERLFFRALQSAHSARQLTIVMVTHDVNTALHFCTHAAGLIEGQLHCALSIDAFRQQCPQLLQTLYGISFERYESAAGAAPLFGTWGGV